MTEPTRRRLAFDRLDAIMPDVERLLAGHTTVGRWNLGAICDHLTRTIDLTLAAPPADAEPTREQTVARRVFFRRAEFPEGQSIPLPEQTPNLHLDSSLAAQALRVALERLATYPGPWPSHPVIGPMSRDEWLLFHTRHAAHHLGFAVPS